MKNPNKKVVANKAVEGEMNMHGVRVMGMTSGESVDSQAGGPSLEILYQGTYPFSKIC